LLLLLRRDGLQPLHPGDRRGMPRHEGPVAAEHHAVDADFVDQEAERLLTADDGVVVEAALVRARRLGDAASLGRHALPAAISAPFTPSTLTARCSSSIAALTSGTGRVARRAKR